ncbi:hypothetical protein DPMN_081216 [Dreissena polymorpha]|uniref:Uncharacterized protein n=1 Tax=Dreissena polymorpha TaxID=45954 RepID=A0A9D3Y7M4_DREPO|nr:hypothetical protein DPMN_081216 [Dreissena polymorpha]
MSNSSSRSSSRSSSSSSSSSRSSRRSSSSCSCNSSTTGVVVEIPTLVRDCCEYGRLGSRYFTPTC